MTESIINNVRIASYNCNSIRSEIDVIREILTRCDALLFQEIIFLEEEISFVYGKDHNFSCQLYQVHYQTLKFLMVVQLVGMLFFTEKKNSVLI